MLSCHSSSKTGCTISISFILFIIFLILKLTGVINWSWWWVTSPLWIGVAIAVVIWVFLGSMFLLAVKASK